VRGSPGWSSAFRGAGSDGLLSWVPSAPGRCQHDALGGDAAGSFHSYGEPSGATRAQREWAFSWRSPRAGRAPLPSGKGLDGTLLPPGSAAGGGAARPRRSDRRTPPPSLPSWATPARARHPRSAPVPPGFPRCRRAPVHRRRVAPSRGSREGPCGALERIERRGVHLSAPTRSLERGCPSALRHDGARAGRTRASPPQ
jgi:hypothetical protein